MDISFTYVAPVTPPSNWTLINIQAEFNHLVGVTATSPSIQIDALTIAYTLGSNTYQIIARGLTGINTANLASSLPAIMAAHCKTDGTPL